MRVHPEFLAAQHLPRRGREQGDIWQRRYREINDWERYLVDNGDSRRQALPQSSRKRSSAALPGAHRTSPTRTGSSPPPTLGERQYWDAYQKAFSEMLSATSTEWAPWHVIPADHKWFTHLVTAAAIIRELAAVDPQYPTMSKTRRQAMAEAKRELEAEAR